MSDQISNKQREVDANYKAFSKMLPELLQTHAGQFAVMRDRETVRFFDTMRDAVIYATDRYEDGRFSVQEVTEEPIDMGWLSCATV